MSEGEKSENGLERQQSQENNESKKITIQGEVNQKPTQGVENAILRGIDESIDAFTGVPAVSGEVQARPLSKEQMISLREKIVDIQKDFSSLTSESNLSGNELELAKVIYIYNYILSKVSYADVKFTNDGHVDGLHSFKHGLLTASSYSALVKNESVCVGISEAIYLLCKYMGVNAEICLAENRPHAFNRVNIGDIWYKLDATYEIGLTPGAKRDGWSSRYFLKGWGNFSTDYPSEEINEMKEFLESKGLNFTNYNQSNITIVGRSDLGRTESDPSRTESDPSRITIVRRSDPT